MRFLFALALLAKYDAGMFARLRRWGMPVAIAASHLLIWGIVTRFHINWDMLSRSRWGDFFIDSALLVVLGADLALLGVWASMAPVAAPARWLAALVSAVSWCFIYDPSIYPRRWIVFYDHGPLRYEYFSRCIAVAGFAALVLLSLATAFFLVRRRRISLEKRETADGYFDGGNLQFQLAHLLLVTFVLSLVLGLPANARGRLSGRYLTQGDSTAHARSRVGRPYNKPWDQAAFAPVDSAETVLLSALYLTTTTLSVTWAALACGPPSLRLGTAWSTAAVLGFACAFAFTAPKHEEQFVSIGLFSAEVGLLQSLLVGCVLIYVRGRGYRLVRANDLSGASMRKAKDSQG
jgi:hypothetical protein